MFGIRFLLNSYKFFRFFFGESLKKKKEEGQRGKEKQAHNFLIPCCPYLINRLPTRFRQVLQFRKIFKKN